MAEETKGSLCYELQRDYITAISTCKHVDRIERLIGVKAGLEFNKNQGAITEAEYVSLLWYADAKIRELEERMRDIEQPEGRGGRSTEGSRSTSRTEVRGIPKRGRGEQDGAPASVCGSQQAIEHLGMEGKTGLDTLAPGAPDGLAEECARLLHEGRLSAAGTVGVRALYRRLTGQAYGSGGTSSSGSVWEESKGFAGRRGDQGVYTPPPFVPFSASEDGTGDGKGQLDSDGSDCSDRTIRMWEDPMGEAASPRSVLESSGATEVVGQVRGAGDDRDRRIRLEPSPVPESPTHFRSIWANGGGQEWIYHTPPQSRRINISNAPGRLVRAYSGYERAPSTDYEDWDSDAETQPDYEPPRVIRRLAN